MPQYVSVKFRPEDKRAYTYHHDGEPLAIGDEVKVGGEDNWSRGYVSGVSDQKPSYETKPILGLAPKRDA